MVGWRRVAHGTPASVADVLTDVVHGTFISGMNAAFGVAALVALAGRGDRPAGPARPAGRGCRGDLLALPGRRGPSERLFRLRAAWRPANGLSARLPPCSTGVTDHRPGWQALEPAPPAPSTGPRDRALRDGSFNLVVSVTSFDHWSDQLAGLRECHRVLVPGSHLVLVDQFSSWLVPTPIFSRSGKAHTAGQTLSGCCVSLGGSAVRRHKAHACVPLASFVSCMVEVCYDIYTSSMALSIKSDEADQLARELAAETGETLTEAVVIALRERLDREHARRAASVDATGAPGCRCGGPAGCR